MITDHFKFKKYVRGTFDSSISETFNSLENKRLFLLFFFLKLFSLPNIHQAIRPKPHTTQQRWIITDKIITKGRLKPKVIHYISAKDV